MSEPGRPNGVPSPTKCRNSGPNLSATPLHRTKGRYPFHATTAKIQPIAIQRSPECFLIHGPRLQPFHSAPCDTRSAVGTRLYRVFQRFSDPLKSSGFGNICMRLLMNVSWPW